LIFKKGKKYERLILEKKIDFRKDEVDFSEDDIAFVITKANPQSAGRKTIRKKLEQLTVKELKERCVKRKIKSTGLRKDELIVALRR